VDAPVLIAHAAVPSVVFLRSRVPANHPSAAVLGEERLGAGVAVGERQVLTAHYLVLGANQIEVTGSDGRARSVSRCTLDHETGLALLMLDGPELDAAPLREAPVRPGLPVFLVTCSDAKERKGASGHISAIIPFEAFWEYMLDQAIMTTVVNPGLAGAGLFDAAGRLLGLVSLGLAAVGRYSLAIPIDLYVRHRAGLEAGDPRATREPRAWVGFYPQVQDGAVVVSGVVPDGPADKAGLERGDLLLTVDGEPIASLRELYAALWRKRPGETVGLQLLRDGRVQVIEVRGGDRYEFYK
jgi:S1-C subfamily serine protease